MPFTKTPDYLKLRGGNYSLKLPIPSDLRPRFLTGAGKPKEAIVEALGTDSESKARQLLKARLGYWWGEFERMRKGKRGELPSDVRKAMEYRESLADARQQQDEDLEFIVESMAVDRAREIEAEAGRDAAEQFHSMATQPEKLTILQALARMHESPDMTEATKAKRSQAIRELLTYLKVADCLPEHVTEDRAVAYVAWLNKSDLGHSTKQDRISNMQTLWKFLVRIRQAARGSSPWSDHEVTGKKKAAANAKGGWKVDDVVKLFRAQEGDRAGHYTRQLFRELYTLGFVTGMRLDEIVSIRPAAVERIKGGYWINVEESKTEAGVRGVPIVHRAAVAILKRRLASQREPDESIFFECRPGGPDGRLSWQVQKALGRDRARLGLDRVADFHSTRRSFLTLMENSGADIVHVQRYVGHRVPTMMHTVYSDGASRENLRKVAEAVKYPAKMEAVFANAAQGFGGSVSK